MSSLNLGLRFFLEVAAVAALVDRGMRASDSTVMGIVIGGGIGVAFVVLWGMLIAPRSSRSPLDQRQRMLAGSALLLGVAVLTMLGGRVALGGVFLALVALNTIGLWFSRPGGMPVSERGER